MSLEEQPLEFASLGFLGALDIMEGKAPGFR
jgi:hypothetical protein